MGLRDRFLRWRTTRGYGVHSPLAFRIVKNVIRPPRDVVYYGEGKIHLSNSPGPSVKNARILLRLVAELQPSYVWTSPSLPEVYLEAIRLAGCVVRIYDGLVFPEEITRADMVVVSGEKLSKAFLKKVMHPGKSLIAFGIDTVSIRNLGDSLKHGIALLGERNAIAVNETLGEAHSYRLLF